MPRWRLQVNCGDPDRHMSSLAFTVHCGAVSITGHDWRHRRKNNWAQQSGSRLHLPSNALGYRMAFNAKTNIHRVATLEKTQQQYHVEIPSVGHHFISMCFTQKGEKLFHLYIQDAVSGTFIIMQHWWPSLFISANCQMPQCFSFLACLSPLYFCAVGLFLPCGSHINLFHVRFFSAYIVTLIKCLTHPPLLRLSLLPLTNKVWG